LRRVVLFVVLAGILCPGGTSVSVQVPLRPMLFLTYPKVCTHGLHLQPGAGKFAVMLFCDDAEGSQLGIICYQPGCEETPWSLSDRFWQDAAWATDVTAFAWDKNGKCLYVSTSEVYGTGEVFALNLPERRYVKVLPPLNGRLVENGRYATTLKAMDTTRNVLTYDVEYFDSVRARPVREPKSLALPACGR
jgi:hypothetical protein